MRTMKIRTTAMGVIPGLLALALLAAPSVQAQTHPVPSRVTAEVDDTNTVKLKGNIHPLARPEFDQGAGAADAATQRGAGDGAATIDGRAADQGIGKLSRVADAHAVWPAVRAV